MLKLIKLHEYFYRKKNQANQANQANHAKNAKNAKITELPGCKNAWWNKSSTFGAIWFRENQIQCDMHERRAIHKPICLCRSLTSN